MSEKKENNNNNNIKLKKRKLNEINTDAPVHKKVKLTVNDEIKVDVLPRNIFSDIKITSQMILDEQQKNNENELNVIIDDNAIINEIKTNGDMYLQYNINKLNWRNDSFHYFNENNIELTLFYIFILDTLNFCFWPLNGYEYSHLAGSLKKIININLNKFNPKYMVNITENELSEWLLTGFNDKNADIPLISERKRLVNESCHVLLLKYNGKVSNLINKCNHDCILLMNEIINNFLGFNDICINGINGKQCFFYKRAQIFIGDIYAAFNGKNIGKFNNISLLTTFPDYRVPQLLNSLDIIKYSNKLTNIIKSKEIIHAQSQNEILIRAATIIAVEKIKNALKKYKNKEFISIEIDWALWNRAEQLNNDNKLCNHHQTYTIFY